MDISWQRAIAALYSVALAVPKEKVGRLQAKLERRLASLRVAARPEAEPTSDDSHGGAHAQWQQVPTEKGGEAVDMAEDG
jgi:hypothetical protein